MKKKIGFIDTYIDEWHANHYPAWIREADLGAEYEVTHAWEQRTLEGKKPLAVWCQEQQVQAAESLEQVVEECDCLVVLSPDHPERHEELSDLALRSGKPVYIDKPFAPTRAAALRMLNKAKEFHTPLMSCSALRFGSALQQVVNSETEGNTVLHAFARGSGVFPVYAIHHLEMLVMLLGSGARRVWRSRSGNSDLLLVDYPDGRRGQLNLVDGHPYQLSIAREGHQVTCIDRMDDFFPGLMNGILRFFQTGETLAPHEETLEIVTLLEAGNRALQTPDQWVEIER